MNKVEHACARLSILLVFSLFAACGSTNQRPNQVSGVGEEYQCVPCGYECDNQVYDKSGKCSKCSMELVVKRKIKFRRLQANEVCDYIKSHPSTILLDVRTKEEYDGKASPNFGTLDNSINIPIQEFQGKIGLLDSLKNREILVFCSHSHRSPRASFMLSEHGFSNVINMEGGMSVLQEGDCIIRK